MGRQKIPTRLLQLLEDADRKAAMDKSCVIDDVHKEAVRLYIETWVRGPLKAAIAYGKGDLRLEDASRWIRYRR
jgi:hypothetical protein